MVTQNKTLNLNSTKTDQIKFLYSYGGEIRIRPTDMVLSVTLVASLASSLFFGQSLSQN
ncbi:unnamed protein product [Amaranthus hypochondriacus]